MEQCRQVKPQTARQARHTIRTLLGLRKGQCFDCMTARYHLRETYGLTYDHHEIALVLDEMNQCGLVDIVGHGRDGTTEYIIN